MPTHYRCRGLLLRQITLSDRHTLYDSSERGIGPLQRPPPDGTQHSQDTDVNAPGGIRTCNPSKRAATDRRLRLRGHTDMLDIRVPGGFLVQLHELLSWVTNAKYCAKKRWQSTGHLMKL